MFKKIEETNPRRARVECFGEFGISEGLIYENWKVMDFNKDDDKFTKMQMFVGLDFGYANDPTAMIQAYVDKSEMKIYVVNEHYQTGMLNNDIANMIKYRGLSKSVIVADSAEPKSIDELKRLGITRIKPSVKGQGSIMQGIQLIQQYEIIIHPSCENFIIEINNYAYDKDKKSGKSINKPIDDFNHLMDAMRYGIQGIQKGQTQVLSKNIFI